MYTELLDRIFKNRKGNILGNYKKSAVMLLICEVNGVECIIYEQRSLSLRHQPGDVCFPGGRIEEGESPKEAAIREATEELGIKEEDIEYLGEMDYFISPYGAIMYPFVGRLKSLKLQPNEKEVKELFMVPIEYFMVNEPMVHEVSIIPQIKEDFPYDMIYGGKGYKFAKGKMNQYFYSYQGHNIWGFTALITKSFIELLKSN